MTDRLFQGLLRGQNGDHRVTNVELFFDLVFVFAVTQLSHLLLEHLSWHGAFQTALLMLAVWYAWIDTAWVTNWLDPARRPVRVMLILLMLVFMLVSATLPEAFHDRGLAFALMFVLAQVGRTAFATYAMREDRPLMLNFARILSWLCLSGCFWIAGGIAHGSTRELLWVIALIIDYLGPVSGFYVPVLGRSTTHDWASISGAHLAERCHLFIIIALGESIVMTGATFAGLTVGFWMFVTFLAAFCGSAALWWIYFDRSAEIAAEEIARSDDPGRLGRSAYTYLHLPMVAGIIVTAVGDELSISHPTHRGTAAAALVICGGPALFLLGHGLFKYAVWKRVSIPRVIAIGALLLLIPVGMVAPLVLTALVSTAVVLGVIAWDTASVAHGVIRSSYPRLEPAESEKSPPFEHG